MASDRRNQLVLVALAVVLAVVAYRLWPGTAAATQQTSNQRSAARSTASRPAVTAPDVHLDALTAERPRPADAGRDLFRFKPRVVAPPAVVRPPDVTPPPPGPPPPPSIPPIPLKFIAVYEVPGRKIRLAVLSDGRGGTPMHGAEGDTVDGRYKILRIGAESIEMSYLDGRGRQTIRLSGQ
jgi:hypothetical protein